MAKYDALFRHLCTTGYDAVEMTFDEIEQLVEALPGRSDGTTRVVEQRPHPPHRPHPSLARRRPPGGDPGRSGRKSSSQSHPERLKRR